MQDLDQLPLEQWATQLRQAREAGNIEFSHMALELRLSAAQLRGLESGSLASFHGPGYYLRAAEKYARKLNITLDPPITELELTDSQLALKRVKNTPSASTLAKKQENLLGASAMPRTMRRSRIGFWLGAILLALVATGTWMAIDEGWPNGDETTLAQTRPLDNNVADQSKPDNTENTSASAPPSSAGQAALGSQSTSAIESEPPSTTAASSTSAVSTTTSLTIATRNLPATNIDTPTPAASNNTSVSVTPPPTTSEPNVGMAPEPAAQPEPAPEPAPESPPPPLPDVIEASFNDDCWVEIRRVDGTTEQGVYKPGQTIAVPVDDIERLTFGNAQAVNAVRAGDPFDVMVFTRGGNNVARILGDDLR